MTSGVIVVAWNGESYLEACLRSVLTQTELPRRLIVVDNDSRDRSLEIARSFEAETGRLDVSLTVVEEPRNTGFTSGANRGLKALIDGREDLDFAVLLNQDATLHPAWCEAATAVLAADPRVGAVGSKILLPNGLTVQHAGGYLAKPRFLGRHYGHHATDVPHDFAALREVDYVTAAAMALRVTTIRAIGTFDEVFSPGYYEDVDWCTRARTAGWKVVYAPEAVATHVESASFRLRPERLSLSHRNRLVYALPHLADASCRREFASAERQYFCGAAPGEDRRALGFAYLWFLLMLPDLAATRIPGVSGSPELVTELIDLFGGLRRDLLDVSHSGSPARSRAAGDC